VSALRRVARLALARLVVATIAGATIVLAMPERLPAQATARPPAATTAATATATPADSARRARIVRVARDIIRSARFAALITQDAATGSSVRTIDPAPPDSAMVIRFVTNPKSRKVREMARDGRVTLYYFDAKAMRYATVHGTAREVRDAGRKAALWYAEWTPFYPQRERGAALYEVVPRKLEVVSEADSVVGDPVTWGVPEVRFRARGVVR